MKIAKDLIAKGADVNAKNNEAKQGDGVGLKTPLMLAARFDHPDIMHALMDAGADAAIKAQDGSTLLIAAASSGHLDAVQYAWQLDPGC